MKKGFLCMALLPLLASCGGGSTGTTSGGTSGTSSGSSSLDGTWDITSYAGDNITGSSVTITGGKMSGSITFNDGCVRTLEFAIEGNSMTASSTPASGCGGNPGTATLAGSRKTPQPDSETPWNGTWDIQGEGNDKGELVISGLSATAGKFKLSVAAGTATATGGSTRYNFVARRK